MPLQFDPPPGTLLLCDYATGFKEPEMVKRRPALVVSPRLRHRKGLCTVVPLSTTPPDRPDAWHCTLKPPQPLPEPWSAAEMWVKADMLATVGYQRLDLFRTPRAPYGQRKYLQIRISAAELEAVRRCILQALGLLT